APVRLGMVEIRVGRAGVGQVSLGGGPRTVGFLPHIDLPRLPKIKKAASRRGEPPSKNVLSGASAASEPAAGASWSGHQIVSGQRGKRQRQQSCRAMAARSAWSLKRFRFPAWRTAEVGEKFGIKVSAFKTAF